MQATQPVERLAALDILRGFALLGILTMNIALGLPGAARLVPTIAGGFIGANFSAWVIGFLLFDEKMITTLSMLFGAGILLIGVKVGSPGKLFLRRQILLLAIGLLHAYLIWEGDILVPYALCGLAVYPFRNLPPRRLLVLAFLVWLPSLALASVFADQFNASPEAAQAFRPGPAEVARLIEMNRNSSWWSLVVSRAPETFGFQTIIFPVSFFWTISARMLLGMALFKMNILSGQRQSLFYLRLSIASYAIGFPFVLAAMVSLIRHNFDPAFLFRVGLQLNQFGSLFVAIGHASLLLWLHKTKRLSPVLALLAHVGRMALTNYLLQSLIATTFFYGYGFGQFGLWDRVHLYYLVFVIWSAQLTLSYFWLRRFSQGPMEWAWRRLTYGRYSRS